MLLIPAALAAWYQPRWLVVVFFVVGACWVVLRAGLILDEQLPIELEGRDVIVEGFIADIPHEAEFGWRFPFAVERAQWNGESVPIPRHILLTISDKSFPARAGEQWRFSVRLKRPHGLQNPGAFDYEAYLFLQRIRAKGYVQNRVAPERLGAVPPRYAIDALRQALGERIRTLLADNPYAGIVVALANGDSRGITPAQWETLRRTGTLHLVAISGLHISLIAGLVFVIARFLWALPGRTVLRVPAPIMAAGCALLAATAYAALAGFVIPTQRALIMLAVALIGIMLRRRFAPTQLLAIALLLVLLHDPLAVMAAGFWLSFAAVAVILFAMHGEKARGAWRKWGYLQWAIALGMFPLMLWLFQQVSVSAPLANMLAVPVFDLLVVPLTLSGIVALAVAPDAIALWFFQAGAWLLQYLWQALVFLSEFKHSQWMQHAPPLWVLVCALVGVTLLLLPRGWPARWIGLIWLLPVFIVRPPGPAPGEIWFTLLDVGQGLAAVVRTHTHVLVYDTGPYFSPAFDGGSAVVVPYLRANGVGRIDALVLSHNDQDHIGGARSIITALDVKRIIGSDPISAREPCRGGTTWYWDGAEFSWLHPTEAWPKRGNNNSCVLMVRSPHGNILLTGDIEARAERLLVERAGEQLAADILIAPHHGSKSSSSIPFVAAVQARHVLFPSGYRNRYRHPHPRVVARYDEAGAQLYDSPSMGALEFRLSAAGIAPTAYRESHKRYWFTP